jgi:hypothetical protein
MKATWWGSKFQGESMRYFIYPLLCAAMAVPLPAQEGHPLVGTWHGTWGPNAKDRTDVTLVLNWDGKDITGMINPGPDALKLQKATLEPSTWGIHFEADTQNGVHVVIDGNIQDVTNVRRTIVGNWTQGNAKGEFKVTRDN